MRDHFRDLRPRVITPRLPGMSAFGTRIAFYEYDAANNAINPPAIAAHPVYLNDVAPADRWKYDLLQPEGIAKIREVIEVSRLCVRVWVFGAHDHGKCILLAFSIFYSGPTKVIAQL